jgi:hypothetical protein
MDQPAPNSNEPPSAQPAESNPPVEPLVPHHRRGCIGTLFLLGCWLVALFGWLWALVAVLHFPDFAEFQKIIFGSAFGLATFVVLLLGRGIGRPIFLILVVATVAAAFFTTPASTKREWADDQLHQATVTFEENTATVHNFRNFSNDPDDPDNDNRWEERKIDLTQVTGVDFIVQPFATWDALPQVLLSFRFSNSPPVSISIEARREQGEEFNPLNAVSRQLELNYIIGSEKDLLGARAYRTETPIYLLPSDIPTDSAAALLKQLLADADKLSQEPRYSNAIWRNSTTILALQIHHQDLAELKPDWQILLPGHADAWLFSLGLIDFEGTPDAARKRFRIRELGILELDEGSWSEMIRGQAE